MKLFCLLLSFIIVNVSSDKTTEYFKREVAITNALVEYAYNMKNSIVGDKRIENGLVHVIKTIVLNGNYTTEIMNHMFSIAENLYLKDIDETVNILHKFNGEIISELQIADPDALRPNLTNLVLKELADNRRRCTGEALRYILRLATNDFADFVDNVTNLVEKRRIDPPECSNSTILRAKTPTVRKALDVPLYEMCQFLVLYMNTKNPSPQIAAELVYDGNETCTATKIYKSSDPDVFVIKKMKLIWWQVDKYHKQVMPLKDLLRTF
ncbi:uncharacterized protein LOC126835395 isoform X2 [Adelges cooleyi]|uniref:uncharacterized protein LOC126835395 isoform X2 n=1 Tax=Adelges cooleyi TaxID=133065 RepID=UPI0021802CCF|nr:uncharacterized protein LOC126835395 isoform X2 [Adelges cooleyi]